MSTKTNNSDTSSSNEDCTLYKFDDIRSSTSFNSSEMSGDTKNPDSGIGTSISSVSMQQKHQTNRFIVKKVELLDELKSLLKLQSNTTNTNKYESNISENKEKNDSNVDLNKDSTNLIDRKSNVKSNNNNNNIKNTNCISSSNEYDVDNLVQKAIHYIKKLQKTQQKNTNDENLNHENGTNNSRESSSPTFSTDSTSSNNFNHNKELVAKINNKNEDMCISILVKTGLIVYVDERLTNLLGQSAKSWSEKRPIDYLYKNDINLLLTKLCDLTNKINAGSKNISDIEIEPFFLRFKKEKTKISPVLNDNNNDFNPVKSLNDTQLNTNTQTKFSILNYSFPRLIYNDDSNEYIAFRVQLKAEKVELKTLEHDDKTNTSKHNNNNQQNINQTEKFNLETCIMFKLSFPSIAYLKDIDNYTERSFISEHDVNLQITRVEDKVTELLGYLPQDLERRSFIKFIHPDDLNKIKQIHYDIFDGKERQNQEIYRWKCHNGCYVSVRTNWSWFIHPWKKQIDFIIGKHVVLNEPLNKNIFENIRTLDMNKQFNKVKNNPCLSSTISVNKTSKNVNTTEESERANNEKSSNFSSCISSREDSESDQFSKIEKDIIEYISKKIPGMDDATQMLGQDVIKFIKKKNISASYCQEQNRLIKKHRQRTFQYKPIKQSKQIFEYPQYFHSTHRLKKPIKILEAKRFKEPKFKFTNKQSIQLKSSSSSNSDIVKANFLNKNLNIPMTSKQASLTDLPSLNKEINELRSSDGSKVLIENELSTENENSNENTNPNVKTNYSINNNTNSTHSYNPVSLSEMKTNNSIEPTASNEPVQCLPALFEDLLSKKSFQPSILKDKGFFTHYMICKYIDDLPNSWGTEEMNTNGATADVSCQESLVELKLDNSNRGLKRSLESEVDQQSEKSDSTSKSIHKESLQKIQKLSLYNNTEIKRAIPNIINSIDLNTHLSSAQNFLGNKTVIDFLLNKKETVNPNTHNLLTNNKDNCEESQILFKKTNSYSSKSHSRIVLIDENDNDDEEDQLTSKMVVIPQNDDNHMENRNSAIANDLKESILSANSNINDLSLSQSPFTSGTNNNLSSTLSNFGYNTNRFDQVKFSNEKYTRLTKEALAKHTREQDDLYILDILKKVQRQLPKKISESPQNICAQAPNVFSRNEYEPPCKKNKIKADSRLLRERNQNNVDFSESSTELAIQYENELNIGPYSSTINEIDCENPQQYHETFNKKLQADLSLSKEKPVSKLKDEKKDQEKLKNENHLNKHLKDKESINSGSSDPALAAILSQESSVSTKNDDVIRFWKKCIKHGSAIVKRLKESDNIIKLVISNNNKKYELEQHVQNQENEYNSVDPNLININSMQTDRKFGSHDESSNNKLIKELKKKLYIIASLLGINTDIGFDDISIDSNKSEIIESYIKKIFQELLSLSSVNLSQYAVNFPTSLTKQIDTNSIEMLICIYEDLKQKFLNQFSRFNKESKLIFNSASSAAFPSSTENNDDESSSFNQQQNKSSTQSRTNTNKSPHEYEYSSNNTNEYDDSSTYLYDSPTSSLESSDLMSNSNEKSNSSKNKKLPPNNIEKSKGQSILNYKTDNQNLNPNQGAKQISFNNDTLSSSSLGNESSNKSNENKQKNKMNELSDDWYANLKNYYPHTKSNITNKTHISNQNEESNYDDSLISKIMQNYIDLFVKKDNDHLNNCSNINTNSQNLNNCSSQEVEMEIDSNCQKEQQKSNIEYLSNKCSKKATNEVIKITNEKDVCQSNVDTSSEESKSNSKKNDREKNENKIEEDCIKNLNLNIYNDCFKCLSKVSEEEKKILSNSNYETDAE